LGARRLCRSGVELFRAYDMDCSRCAHGVPDRF
jgi:hypothetical protein